MATRNDRLIALWLLLVCGLVFAMVVLGGVTRLTGSGLSMVDWRPVTGVLPPLSDSQWREVFELYQSSPEYRQVNAAMDVEGFKGIFWLEYLHRLLGRLIGIAFLVPFLLFVATGRIGVAQTPRYLLMFLLGGLQGLLGWYMVKSGLVDNPHVSPYRLTAHLMLAFAIYGYMLWVALTLLAPKTEAGRHPLSRRALALGGLVTMTIASGGFVAGLKAGLAFNTFPLMGGKIVPDGLTALTPLWRNAFENIVMVQFNHRVLALTTLALVGLYWLRARRTLSGATRTTVNVFAGFALLQVVLGVSTLVMKVPTTLAAAHQASALLLFSAALIHCHALYRARYSA